MLHDATNWTERLEKLASRVAGCSRRSQRAPLSYWNRTGSDFERSPKPTPAAVNTFYETCDDAVWELVADRHVYSGIFPSQLLCRVNENSVFFAYDALGNCYAYLEMGEDPPVVDITDGLREKSFDVHTASDAICSFSEFAVYQFVMHLEAISPHRRTLGHAEVIACQESMNLIPGPTVELLDPIYEDGDVFLINDVVVGKNADAIDNLSFGTD